MLKLTIRSFPLQDLIVRLNKENGSVKQNLEATNAALSASRIEGSRASTSGTFSIKVVLHSNFWVSVLCLIDFHGVLILKCTFCSFFFSFSNGHSLEFDFSVFIMQIFVSFVCHFDLIYNILKSLFIFIYLI
jgi:hypothetical protein